ncbi:MAG: histidine triad nucleotide-binding protein [Oscillospiraceae bacterium]|nr:histidine triad nucleotide-binding protein [Oscillospiraceae bacterium]
MTNQNPDCLFCKIIAGEIPSKKIYENDEVYAFADIQPIAPVHYLFVTKTHICCAKKINTENSQSVAKIFEAIAEVAEKENIDSYRVITNCGEDAGQSVMHLHFHMVAGKKMGWGEQSLG